MIVARIDASERRQVLAVWVGVALFLAGCGGGDHRASTASPTTPPSTSTATSVGSTTAINKGCLKGNERAFRFQTSTGANLVGVALGTSGPGLVFGHMNGQDLCAWLPEARAFAKRSYRTEVFDFEGFGDSQPGSGAVRYDLDVVAATAQLRQRGATKVVLIGASMGGTAVVAAATQIKPPAAGVVSLSAPIDFRGLDAEAAAAHLKVPALFLAGAQNQPYANYARSLYRATAAHDKRLVILQTAVHGIGLISEDPKVLAMVEKFIIDHTKS
jgi:pimeloyl-ACP methyl ester carboxylesterase